MDAHEDAASRRAECGSAADRPPLRVIYGGVGDVTKRDVMVAQTAKALIVAYGVGVEKDAARLAQTQNVRLAGFDCMQDAVDLVTNTDATKSEKLTSSLTTKPKRRDTSTD